MLEQYHHDHPQWSEDRARNRRSLIIALAITALFMVTEVIGGILSNSLALLSDAGHMLSDAVSLGLSLFAMWIASRPPSVEKTYGYYRLEVLAALFNGVTLIAISLYIFFEAAVRFLNPPTVSSETMLAIAVIGLAANLVSAFVLSRGDVKENINMRSAFLHVLGDLLGSIGAIIAGILMLKFGWYIVDPLISAIIGALVLVSGVRVSRESVHILMEGSPKDFPMKDLVQQLKNIDGVRNVHEIHIWTITSNFHSLSCHLVIEQMASDQNILKEAKKIIRENFNIQHATVQIERKAGTN